MSGKNPLGNGKEPQSYEGANLVLPAGGWRLVISVRAPTTNDFKYPLGAIWINKTTSTSYQLVTNPGIWTILGNATGGDIQSLTGGTGGAILPTLGNINLLGTANQINTVGSGDTITWSLTGPYAPATYTDHGVLVGSGTSDITALSVGATGTLLAGATGADPAFTASPTITGTFTAGTGLVSLAGNIAANTGAVNAGTSMTATLGNITATNGNFVKGTAGNKDVYSSVATNATAGANSAGSVTLAGGTATVATTAVTASSLIRIYRQGIGSTGAAALGILTIGTITAATSFVINSVGAADATALQASDVSVVFWEIVN